MNAGAKTGCGCGKGKRLKKRLLAARAVTGVEAPERSPNPAPAVGLRVRWPCPPAPVEELCGRVKFSSVSLPACQQLKGEFNDLRKKVGTGAWQRNVPFKKGSFGYYFYCSLPGAEYTGNGLLKSTATKLGLIRSSPK